MTDPALLSLALSAFGLGLAGAGHCLGMCGGIAAALNLGGERRLSLTLAYHAGRVFSYALLGGLLGLLAGSVDIAAWTIGLRYLAGALLIGMGLYVADWWRGMAALERAGAYLWQPVQRFSSRLLPLRHPLQALALGLCWGLMPCGLIYSSLAWAATAQNAWTAAGLMFCFGIGTLPAMLATSLGAAGLQGFLRRRGLKLVIALLLIASGIWTLYLVAAHAGHLRSPQPGAAAPAHEHHHM
ncbi:sulfite exporter TauE/SafE family protein [Mangrovimicrobium sediminis]|uniref:Sulfite exporter TauE/SafE family protein n=1 Tax=Mangrovimicrobium sediminis TaxID=2562682 RepID=A0A4Z0M500_9GAMM|nr:sulfite exporter TauE/SafE family protein [Haliea sp. SAOS-164]TGD74554.1 sulfite exporter TauE/SafE family protein [Haliea sp. SAOS-164]